MVCDYVLWPAVLVDIDEEYRVSKSLMGTAATGLHPNSYKIEISSCSAK
jgi:hypothetical protein